MRNCSLENLFCSHVETLGAQLSCVYAGQIFFQQDCPVCKSLGWESQIQPESLREWKGGQFWFWNSIAVQ